MEDIYKDVNLVTDDPLGIGGLLFDANRAAQMIVPGYLKRPGLFKELLRASLTGLGYPSGIGNSLRLPADYRLAFQELGLSIGLHAIERLDRIIQDYQDVFNQGQNLKRLINSLMEYSPMAHVIEEFWLNEPNQQSITWTEHRDINTVMLATSLAPEGFLEL